MVSGFKSIEFKKDEYIYADTSALLQFIGYNSNGRLKREVADILSKAYNESVPVVVSTVALNEISHVIMRGAFERNGYSGQDAIKWLQKQSPDTYNKIHGEAINDYNSYKHKLLSNEAILKDIIYPSENAWKEKDELMDKHKIFGSTDALHLAVALDYGMNYFLTTDTDFQNLTVPEIQIICLGENNTK